MPDQSGTSQPDADGITRARFRPITDGQPGEPLPVHFNPETLEYQLTNNIDQRGNSNSNKQYISQSTGKLTMQLLFDTTDTGTDVRSVTERLQALMKPKEEGRKRVAQVVQFEWGAFRFKGTFDSYKETRDYFSSSSPGASRCRRWRGRWPTIARCRATSPSRTARKTCAACRARHSSSRSMSSCCRRRRSPDQ